MAFAMLFITVNAQEPTSYQKPSKEIADLLLAPPTPTISVDGKAQYMLLMERSLYPTLTSSSATQGSAFIIGENLAVKALKKNITYCVFDRGNRPYHGRIKNVAEGARKQGLIF